MSDAFHLQWVHYVTPYDPVWWKVLCVFSLWEGIHWADQLEEKCDTAQWRETFPPSLWWEFRSEIWSEKTDWKTACSKIVIWSVQVFQDVTCWYSSTSRDMNHHCSKTACSIHTDGLKLFILCICFILSISVWMCVTEVFFPPEQLPQVVYSNCFSIKCTVHLKNVC